ncbi:hypothetical protein KY358_00795 [Candidatus Woesearchaeota archaeon]|nr:hypothetical protein [Candidatus Woesearchaeota archaeon]
MYNGDYFGDGSRLMMKWSDSWLSNKDCDGDDVLDRHLGFETYIGSGAWLTNHWFNEYVADDVTCYQEEFIKIVAVPEDAANVDGFWYDADGVQIGESIWGQFAIIQYNWYDSCDPEGSYTMHEAMPGLGNW